MGLLQGLLPKRQHGQDRSRFGSFYPTLSSDPVSVGFVPSYSGCHQTEACHTILTSCCPSSAGVASNTALATLQRLWTERTLWNTNGYGGPEERGQQQRPRGADAPWPPRGELELPLSYVDETWSLAFGLGARTSLWHSSILSRRCVQRGLSTLAFFWEYISVLKSGQLKRAASDIEVVNLLHRITWHYYIFTDKNFVVNTQQRVQNYNG